MGEMTDEQIRLACAEECHWREAFPGHGQPHPETRRGGILLPYKWVNEVTHERMYVLPDYLNSRDTCAEFEATLKHPADQLAYYRALVDMIEAKPGACVYWETTTATPRQRCLAFLRVKRPELFRA